MLRRTPSPLLRGVTLVVLLGALAANLCAQSPGPALAVGKANAPEAAVRIVLIGGKKSHGPGMHDFPNGIPFLAALLRAAPAFAGADILSFTSGFPTDLAVLHRASTIVLYFDGVMEKPEPLLDPARIAALQQAMDNGAGLIALHQASTLPAGDTSVPLVAWLGAKRDGMFDRATETVTLRKPAASHPVTAGVSELTYRDEFYPTLVFSRGPGQLTPLLTATFAATSGDGVSAGATPAAARDHVVAWAFERPNGGRGFGFTGLHFYSAFNLPQIRQLLVNAVAWTARLDVPNDGVPLIEPVVGTSSVMRRAHEQVVTSKWGEVRWQASAELGNSRTLTVGEVRLKPGQSNPRHYHPNCDEVLHVVSGRIRHTMNEVSAEMGPGDTVSIPQGVLHNATNIGTDDAILTISFSTAYRQAIGYEEK